ncbi:LOW QUALITY PROTEIN: glyoxalase domain-containing protein 4 [Schistocerca piceifrons]|uniref:LOW QUALITY PROTEIN: glyoxalase domain-containing protein 4 n=1 Tax=Schistocerca piceifrons TaxID=274613 RepID=UPI001F5F4FE7|nr:LOW QUALITY PROTEIN: glyoxalase domain-containing protein 4 [Schistocerca piceifrons]
MIQGRALHFVFKVADRTLTAKFYREVLGMKVLRHEEFTEGCAAACNGPYDNRWSKTMVGYGPEDTHFVVELTYNYNVHSYEKGNDFIGITVRSKEAIERAKAVGWPLEQENGLHVATAPGGYKFFLINDSQPTGRDPVEKVALASSNLSKSIQYWNGILGLKKYNETGTSVLLGFGDNQAKLELFDIGKPVEHKTAYGRIAFSCPFDEQPKINKKIEETNNTILTPLTSLDTPRKATVRVIILADPDGHEICFVDDEGFRELSKVDPEGEALLDKYIKKDLERMKTE